MRSEEVSVMTSEPRKGHSIVTTHGEGRGPALKPEPPMITMQVSIGDLAAVGRNVICRWPSRGGRGMSEGVYIVWE